ncbi:MULTISPECIES: helix-turn-helix transcriptional regulator [Halorubrum]|uniref:helix-turn-helix transcriptional regulator n=1 Tax=Halorubrum TaxID=56688 RepID=UPI0010F45C57|nr:MULTISPECIES: helix-turn-helix transcriptional regulator [Halorubrum]TKX67781.1 ArsR family transcriptional regulator [Halorubrum sp. GN11GM_10-3_MGM]
MKRMKQTDETRQFISAILEESGSASTAKIRRRTDLTEGQLQHQFRKLERYGFIEIDRSSVESQSGSRMKIAVIPETKREEAEALLSHNRKPERTSVDIVELANEVDKLTTTIEEIQEYIAEDMYNSIKLNKKRINKLEEQLTN